MSPTRTVIVCADDFAQNEEVSAATLELVEAACLSAVSCFTDAPLWRSLGPLLRDRADTLLLGLHFNLTQPFGYGERSLVHWLGRAFAGAVDRAAVLEHLQRQFERFIEIVGREPDYIDGHHHVHVLPVVRAVVRDFVAASRPNHHVKIRAVVPFFGATDAPLKRIVIRSIATISAAGRAQIGAEADLNTGFGGDYSLRASAEYPKLFAGWLARAPDGGLIMCHPGLAGAGEQEYRFLKSQRCRKLFATEGVKLATAADLFGPGRAPGEGRESLARSMGPPEPGSGP